MAFPAGPGRLSAAGTARPGRRRGLHARRTRPSERCGLRTGPPQQAAHQVQADQDPAAVVFGLGYGPVHESLPFAAAVLESVRRKHPAPLAAAPSWPVRGGVIRRTSPSGYGTSGTCTRPVW
ncbi:hypothetical protein NKH18_14080 [Streptomyces sp. M10(2022)]